jgi:hypothetical protein
MAYVRLDDQIASHPKVLRAGAEAAWLWACAIAYCNRQLTDGHVPAAALPTMGTFRTAPKKLADALVTVGLFEADTDGYRVHDYLQHNPDKATVQQRMREASQRKAASRGRRGHADVPSMSQRDTHETGVTPHAGATRGSRTNSPPPPTPEPTASECEAVGAPTRPSSIVPFDAEYGAMPTRRRSAALAWEGTRDGLGVPHKLHRDLLSKMATPDEAALLAWYAETEREWNGRAIGDTTFQFWEARFREWQGTTRERSSGGLQPLSDFIPTRFRNGGQA